MTEESKLFMEMILDRVKDGCTMTNKTTICDVPGCSETPTYDMNIDGFRYLLCLKHGSELLK